MNNVSVVGYFQLRSIRVACAHHGFLWGYESWKDLPVAERVYLQFFHAMKNCFSKLAASSPPLSRASSTFILTSMWPCQTLKYSPSDWDVVEVHCGFSLRFFICLGHLDFLFGEGPIQIFFPSFLRIICFDTIAL